MIAQVYDRIFPDKTDGTEKFITSKGVILLETTTKNDVHEFVLGFGSCECQIVRRGKSFFKMCLLQDGREVIAPDLRKPYFLFLANQEEKMEKIKITASNHEQHHSKINFKLIWRRKVENI